MPAAPGTGPATGSCTWINIYPCCCCTCSIPSAVRYERCNRLVNSEKSNVNSAVLGHRWAIEIFFRFFKHVLGCRHLLSDCQNGIELQTYAAIIACMLISLWTGRKPTLRTYEMLCWYFTGMADEEELLAHISRLQKQG
jgi:hypothetical protein